MKNPGLYDNIHLNRRELWLEWKGKPLFYGWADARILDHLADDLFEPKVSFGNFPKT